MYKKYIKRILDIICALAAILVFWWLYIIVAVLVKIKLGSPVIFKQKRPGKNEKIFTLYKFRTMTDKKDENGNLLSDDLRLTRFGRLLRKTSLDELPEAFNILKGDMSVVGPRPLLVRDMTFMTNRQRQRHSITPGLTGLAQINGRNNITWEQKLEYDIDYITSKVTFKDDCLIILKTIYNFLKQKDTVRTGTASDMDFGDWLMLEGKINQAIYDQKINEANKLLGAK